MSFLNIILIGKHNNKIKYTYILIGPHLQESQPMIDCLAQDEFGGHLLFSQ